MAGGASDMRPGARNLITDVAGLRVGNADDDRLLSGVTCLTSDTPFTAAVDIRGGAPGTREIALLDPDKTVTQVDALVLSGGSAFGLDAAGGVMDRLRSQGRGYAVGPARVPIVPSAILFDLLNGGHKDWDETPYPALGRVAFDTAQSDFELGSAGAGKGATTARVRGGLGSASWVLDDGTTVGALVAANPVGCATIPGTRHFWAWADEWQGEFGGLGPPDSPPAPLTAADIKLGRQAAHGANTTIAIVATDAALDTGRLKRLATAAHDGLARAVQPSHTPMDGDLVFAVSTGQRSDQPSPVQTAMLGHAAATCLSRAVARAIFLAEPGSGGRPAYQDLS